MKFFKHFTDAHRGHTIQTLREKMGHRGVSCYWTLVEMCAEKLDKGADELFNDTHCKFRFHERQLLQTLVVSRRNLSAFVHHGVAAGAFTCTVTAKSFEFVMPKLLECLDRDAKRARTERAMAAPKKKSKDKEITNFKILCGKLREGIRRFGPHDGDAFKEFIGEEDWPLVLKVGVRKIRDLPPDQWFDRNLTGMLKEAWEGMTNGI